MLQFPENTFPENSFVRLDFTSAGPVAFAVGFSSNTDFGIGRVPNVGQQDVVACTTALADATSHICAAFATTALCAGDNGAGLYVQNEDGTRGLVSNLNFIFKA